MGSDVRIIFLMSTIWMLLRSLMVLKRSVSHRDLVLVGKLFLVDEISVSTLG